MYRDLQYNYLTTFPSGMFYGLTNVLSLFIVSCLSLFHSANLFLGITFKGIATVPEQVFLHLHAIKSLFVSFLFQLFSRSLSLQTREPSHLAFWTSKRYLYQFWKHWWTVSVFFTFTPFFHLLFFFVLNRVMDESHLGILPKDFFSDLKSVKSMYSDFWLS